MFQQHDLFGFTGVPGTPLRDHVEPRRAKRMSEPLSPRAPCPWLDVVANNVGFYSPRDYPYSGGDGDGAPHVVGVFGGSVAHWFALQVGDTVAARISATVDGGGPVALNCAVSGWKQPQPLHFLDWMLRQGQRFDAIVLIDGFNDVALTSMNVRRGVPATSPSAEHMQFLVGGVEAGSFGGQERVDQNTEDEILENWARCTMSFQTRCHESGIPLAHLLQPNQYFSAKRFTAKERFAALNTTNPYRAAVERLYPRLIRRAAELTRDGFPVVDATTAFDGVSKTVYADTCCHYNVRGNLLLADIAVAALRPEELDETRPVSRSIRARLRGRRDFRTASDTGRRSPPSDDLYPMW